MYWGYGDYIKRDDVLEITAETGALTTQIRVRELPAADVRLVEHGRWKLNADGSGTCLNCRMTFRDLWDDDHWFNYCPSCGAKMEVEA